MKATNLGDFEELVLITVCILKEEAYAVSIKKDLEQRLSKKINISAIHTALYRLEDKGFLESILTGATSERGGRRKRYFQTTQKGATALIRLKELRSQMYQLVPALKHG